MALLRFFLALMLPLFGTWRVSFASPTFGVQRIPLGDSLLQLEARGLHSRDDKSSDCDIDPDCSPVDWGCQCGSADVDWMDITSSAAPTPTLAPTPPPPPTPQESPTVAPVIPPAQASCVPSPNGPVKDAHEADTKLAAAYFCKWYASMTVTTPNVDVAHTIMAGTIIAPINYEGAGDYAGTDNEDDVYDFHVKSVDSCKPDGGVYNLGTPVPNTACADILFSAWKGCGNQGRGGALTAGCLVYSIATKY